jgi:hypothetical protein
MYSIAPYSEKYSVISVAEVVILLLEVTSSKEVILNCSGILYLEYQSEILTGCVGENRSNTPTPSRCFDYYFLLKQSQRLVISYLAFEDLV